MLFQASPPPAFDVFTALYEKDGRKFRQIGSYKSSNLCLTSDQDMFPNVKFGLNGRHLIVSTNYVRNCKCFVILSSTKQYVAKIFVSFHN